MRLLTISIVESVYLTYMFHFLQTSVDFNFMESPTTSFFKHAVGNEKTYRICPFGKYAIVLLIAVLLGRNLISISKFFVAVSMGIALFLSLMNMNALIYLLPVVIVEGVYYFRNNIFV